MQARSGGRAAAQLAAALPRSGWHDAAGAGRDRHLDGLRAIAIAMVVAAHCGIRGAGGGFVGVDVFYVLSGFLITRLLLREQGQNGRIDLVAFLARRARRLVPALVVMILAVLAAGWLLLLPDEQWFLAQTSLSSLAFATNIQFVAMAQDYFAPRSALSPLQHLWTLGVEAQFYLIWPLIIIVLKRDLGAKHPARADLTVAALTIITLVSLMLGIVLTPRDPVGSFYLLHTRGWELAVGGLLCCAPRLPERWARLMPPLAMVGLIIAMVQFRGVPFYPSYLALLPVTAAAMVILGAMSVPDQPVVRWLSSGPMVYLGRRSYGLYLWHWPLLVFARIWWPGQVSAGLTLLLMAAAFALAIASWRWIEEPVIAGRGAARLTKSARLAVAAGALVTCALPAVILGAWSVRALQPGSIIAQYRSAKFTQQKDFPFCHDGTARTACVFGDRSARRSLLLYGDSHAAQLSYGLDAAARAVGVRIVARTMASCAPTGFDSLQPATRAVRDACRDFNAQTIAGLPALHRDEAVVGVIVAGTWGAADEGWGERLMTATGAMRRAGLRVVIARDTPAQPEGFLRSALAVAGTRSILSTAQLAATRRSEGETLERIASNHDMRVWSSHVALCPARVCPIAVEGKLLYRNASHLTVFGSKQLGPALVAPVAWAAGKEDQPRIPKP